MSILAEWRSEGEQGIGPEGIDVVEDFTRILARAKGRFALELGYAQ